MYNRTITSDQSEMKQGKNARNIERKMEKEEKEGGKKGITE